MAIGKREADWLRANSKLVVDLPEDVFLEFLGRLSELMSVSSRSKADEYVISTARQRSIDEEMVRAGMAWVTTVANAALGGTRDEVTKEFAALFDADAGREVYMERLQRVIEATVENAGPMQMAIQKKASVRGLLPYYEDLNATVELRAVLDDSSTMLGHLGRGDARISALEPIASIRLSLDSGFPSETIFQAGRDDLEQMVVALNDLIRRMDEIEHLVARNVP